MIEQYLESLRVRLPGPRLARRELLRELGDGLRDAASVYQMRGMSRQQAEHRAVAESGTPDELAPQYREALTVIQGRRTACVYAVSAPASILAWSYVWSDPTAAMVASEGTSTLARFCWDLIDYAGYISSMVAAGVLLLLMLAARKGWPSRPFVLLPALVGMAHVCITMVASTIGNVVSGGGLFGKVVTVSPLLAALGAASILLACWQCGSSVRTILASRTVRTTRLPPAVERA